MTVPLLRSCLIAANLIALSPAAAENTKNALPPYTPAYQPRTVDERGLWMEADEDERALRDSPLVIKDEQLNAYVARTVPDRRRGSLQGCSNLHFRSARFQREYGAERNNAGLEWTTPPRP